MQPIILYGKYRRKPIFYGGILNVHVKYWCKPIVHRYTQDNQIINSQIFSYVTNWGMNNYISKLQGTEQDLGTDDPWVSSYSVKYPGKKFLE